MNKKKLEILAALPPYGQCVGCFQLKAHNSLLLRLQKMEYCQKYDLDHVIYVKQNIFPSKFKNYKERKSHQ